MFCPIVNEMFDYFNVYLLTVQFRIQTESIRYAIITVHFPTMIIYISIECPYQFTLGDVHPTRPGFTLAVS